MTDVYERVAAVLETGRIVLRGESPFPKTPHPQSPFGEDAALVDFRTYDVARTLMATGLTNLRAAAQLSKQRDTHALGTHLIALRPALVATSKALWMLEDGTSRIRVARAAGITIADRESGISAMKRVSGLVEPSLLFAAARDIFERGKNTTLEAVQRAGIEPARPPSDTLLIKTLGEAIDRYYFERGVNAQDALVLWHASSSLSHAERWFKQLAERLPALAERVTKASLDVACSSFNLLWQDILAGTQLATSNSSLESSITRKDAPDLPEV